MRRHNKSADPVLCVTYGCYVSAGSAWPARFMPGHRALGILNTWGARAGACRDSLECVFRAIEVVELPGYLQPVDLRLLRHDRRRPQMITSDSACTVERARLLCTRGIYAEDYAMWIVPESIAAAAGPDALQRAAAEGLRRPQVAGLSPQP
jgi:colicin import membrane protein